MSISDTLQETIEVFRKKDDPADIWNKCSDFNDIA
jgi:hypothetical protein